MESGKFHHLDSVLPKMKEEVNKHFDFVALRSMLDNFSINGKCVLILNGKHTHGEIRNLFADITIKYACFCQLPPTSVAYWSEHCTGIAKVYAPPFSQSEEISSYFWCFYGGGVSHNEDIMHSFQTFIVVPLPTTLPL